MSTQSEVLPPALSAKQIKSLITRRYLAHVGWNGTKVDGKERLITRPITMIGHAGIGKTEMPYQAAVDIAKTTGLKVQVRMTNLQFCELPDFMGLPYNDMSHGDHPHTKHGIPEILPQDGFGIWFLDEPNRAGRDIRSGLLTLLQARQVNGVPLGKNWMIVLAMNPAEADGQTYEVSTWDTALQDRIAPVTFEPSLEEFLEFITEKYSKNDPVVRWIRIRGRDVVNFKGDGRCTPRGLEFLIRAIRSEENGVMSKTFWETAAAEVGQGAANAFKKFLHESVFVKPDEIIDSYNEEVRDKIRAFEEEGRVDVINSLTDGLAERVLEKANALGDKWPTGANPNFSAFPEFTTWIKNLTKYLDEASADSGHSFMLATCDKFPDKDKFTAFCYHMKQQAPAFTAHYHKLKVGQEKAAAAQKEKAEKEAKPVEVKEDK
jgi:hypothetical protein